MLLVFIILDFSYLSFAFKVNRHPSPRLSLAVYNKIKVKLIADVKGQGKKGDIILVSPAMLTNVLLPNKQARVITDEEIQRENKEKQQKEMIFLNLANRLSNEIQTFTDNKRIVILKKVGNAGQLFGTVTKNNIIELLIQNVQQLSELEEKYISIEAIKSITDTDSKSPSFDEVRKAGIYQVTIRIHPKVTSTFEVEVKSDK